MDLDMYQRLAMVTANKDLSENDRLLNASLGLCGESGEFADLIKKIVYHSHPLDFESYQKLAKELGDILWYVALGAHALDLDLSAIAEMNIDKLKKRYPEGFSSKDSINRVEEDAVEVSTKEWFTKVFESKPRRKL